MGKYFYIDKDGNKKKYVGQIYDAGDGTTFGILTSHVRKNVIHELTYIPEVKGVQGYPAYFTYNNINGDTCIFDGYQDQNTDGSYSFTIYNTSKIELKYHAAHSELPGYYTYVDAQGNNVKYTGNTYFNTANNTYYAII